MCSALMGKLPNGYLLLQGYWMVKRAVGTKACLLGKAVTCKYFRQDNFLEVILFAFITTRNRTFSKRKFSTIQAETDLTVYHKHKV